MKAYVFWVCKILEPFLIFILTASSLFFFIVSLIFSHVDTIMQANQPYLFRTLFSPIHGVDEDLREFIRLFEANNNLRFSAFTELWRKHKLVHMIYGRQTQHGLYDILGCIFHRLVDIIMLPDSAHNIFVRVCALYLLYAFHGIQPLKNHVSFIECKDY